MKYTFPSGDGVMDKLAAKMAGHTRVLGQIDDPERISPLFGRAYKDLSFDEKQEDFAHTREHGLLGDIEFAVGGSDSATILGISPWKTAKDLFDEKRKGQKEELSVDQKMRFALGHIFEESCLDLFNVYSENEYEGYDPRYRVYHFSDQCASLKFPHLVGNVDGIVYDALTDEVGIFENKTTSNKRFAAHHEWVQGIVPEYYETQGRFYMGVYNVDFVIFHAFWGIGKGGSAWTRIDRDLEFEKSILSDCENFAENTVNGVEPTIFDTYEQGLISKAILEKYRGKTMPLNVEINDPEILSLGKRLVEHDLKTDELLSPLKALEKEREAERKELDNMFTDSFLSIGTSNGKMAFEDMTVFVDYTKPAGRMGFHKDICETKFPEILPEVYFKDESSKSNPKMNLTIITPDGKKIKKSGEAAKG
jgi:predicted phage-related endonuclease